MKVLRNLTIFTSVLFASVEARADHSRFFPMEICSSIHP